MDKKFTLLGWLGFMMTLMLAVVLASCGTSDESVDISENSDTIQEENNATQGEGNLPVLYEWSVDSVFAENSGTRFGIQTTEDGQGIYYTSGQKVNYYDPELEISTVVCPQQGCLHQDASCVAWQGDILSFGAYRDMWYALLAEEDGSICVRRTDPSDNSREVIFRYSLPDDKSRFSVSDLYFSYGCAYFSVLTYTEHNENAWQYDAVNAAELVRLDLESGQTQCISFEDGNGVTFVGGNETTFAVVCTYLDTETEPLLSEEEFYAQNPGVEELYEGAAYFDYYSKYTMIDHLVSELRVYDITSGAYEVLASGTDLVASERGKMCYGNVIVYDLLDHDTGESALWLYDLDTTQSVCIARDNWIVEYVILDGKVIYNVSQLDGNYTFYCVDIYTGAVSPIDNQGRTDFMIFPIMGETVDHMIASNGFSRESLHKTEYYDDDYSSVEGF